MNIHRIKSFRTVLFLFALSLFSCLSAPEGDLPEQSQTPEASRVSLLPLVSGWYLYNFERTFKGIEDEYNFAQSTGMKMVEEITVRQTGTVTFCEEGVLHDPVLDTYLTVDEEGQIRSIENPSISGTLSENGSFFWSGLIEEHGRLNQVAVTGSLVPLPPSSRAGSQYDGLYHLTDTATGREQLALVKDGLYTWSYIDGEDAGFTPWPTLIQPDGSFSYDMEWTTVLEMGDSKANYSTGFIAKGKISPGLGISLETATVTAGATDSGGKGPEIYAGVVAREAEFPNEKLPEDVEAALPAAVSAAKKAPPPNLAGYPSWYINPPKSENAFFGVGQKTFSVRDTAFAMAEAAAAANIALQIRSRVESSIEESENASGRRSESLVNIESMEKIPYRVVERIYREDTETAFVLLELVF